MIDKIQSYGHKFTYKYGNGYFIFVFDKDEYRLELFDLIKNQDMLICAYQSLSTDTAKLKILSKLIKK